MASVRPFRHASIYCLTCECGKDHEIPYPTKELTCDRCGRILIIRWKATAPPKEPEPPQGLGG